MGLLSAVANYLQAAVPQQAGGSHATLEGPHLQQLQAAFAELQRADSAAVQPLAPPASAEQPAVQGPGPLALTAAAPLTDAADMQLSLLGPPALRAPMTVPQPLAVPPPLALPASLAAHAAAATTWPIVPVAPAQQVLAAAAQSNAQATPGAPSASATPADAPTVLPAAIKRIHQVLGMA